MTGPGQPPGPVDASALPVRVLTWNGTAGVAGAEGRSFPFSGGQVVGFHPVPGLAVRAELDASGALRRLTLPAHPTRAEPVGPPPFGWVSVRADVALGTDAVRWRDLLHVDARMRLVARRLPDGAVLVEVTGPGLHVLVRERRATPEEDARLERRLAPDALPPVVRELVAGALPPGEERRMLGREAPDAWAEDGTARRTLRLALRLLDGGGTHLVLERAGGLVLSAGDARARIGAVDDAQARAFGALVDWALTPDRATYRTLGMTLAGGEDVEIAVVRADADVELDSAESALLFACHLQAREARLLEDGEVFYVPKDVRIGPRGATAASRTGYKYLVRRGRSRVELVRG